MKNYIELLSSYVIDKPLVCFDLETTGTNTSTDRIVQIGAVAMYPDKLPTEFVKLVNPCIPIPAGATKVHGITDEMVSDAPAFGDLDLFGAFDRADWIGFNIKRFDAPLLIAEFERAGKALSPRGRRIIDVMPVYHAKHPRDLSSAVKLYTSIEGFEDVAHDALADVKATAAVAVSMMGEHDIKTLDAFAEESTDPSAIDYDGKFKLDDEGAPVFNFGDFRGESVYAADLQGYPLKWMLGKDFGPETLQCAKHFLGGGSVEELLKALDS